MRRTENLKARLLVISAENDWLMMSREFYRILVRRKPKEIKCAKLLDGYIEISYYRLSFIKKNDTNRHVKYL